MSENDGFTVNNFDHLAEQSDVGYGIYDTRDNCWIGDNVGSRVFTRKDSEEAKGIPQETMAKIAAMMAGVQLGYAVGRLQARVFNETDLQMTGEMPTKMTAEEALIKLESGDKGVL